MVLTGTRANRATGQAGEDALAARVVDLTVTFNVAEEPVTALANVSVDVPRGGFLSVLGPSGCGKSTLLRVLANLVPPDAGAVSVLGKSPAQARFAREVGFVFQDHALMPWRNVIDNVRLPLAVGAKRVRSQASMTPDEALELVGLSDFRSAYPGQLSGGMRQRVSIARALVTAPQILLMDEPFGALDEITRDRMNVELLQLWQRSGVTIVFVTHSIPEAAFLADAVLVMSARPGRVRGLVPVAIPRPRDLAQRETAEFNALVTRLRTMLGEESAP